MFLWEYGRVGRCRAREIPHTHFPVHTYSLRRPPCKSRGSVSGVVDLYKRGVEEPLQDNRPLPGFRFHTYRKIFRVDPVERPSVCRDRRIIMLFCPTVSRPTCGLGMTGKRYWVWLDGIYLVTLGVY